MQAQFAGKIIFCFKATSLFILIFYAETEEQQFLLKRKQIISSRNKVALPRNVKKRLENSDVNDNQSTVIIKNQRSPMSNDPPLNAAFNFSGMSRTTSGSTNRSLTITTASKSNS